MARLPRQPNVWLAGFLIWFMALWMLSSSDGGGGYVAPVDHFDKVAHFGYFLGGGGLLFGYFLRLNAAARKGMSVAVAAILVVALIGWLDEWHQTFTPGRSGNDWGDWLADVAGATAGVLIMKRLQHPDD